MKLYPVGRVLKRGLGAFASFIPVAALAANVTLPPSDDIGASLKPTRTVLSANAWDHAYIKFPLSDVARSITTAKLRLYVKDSQAITTQVWAADSDSWSEAQGSVPKEIGHDWGNTPLATVSHAGTGFVEFDVSGFVAAEQAGDGIASFEVSNGDGGWRSYGSRESAQPPVLLLTTDGSAPPPPPPPAENQSPVASISISPQSGDAPLPVTVDGTASYDPDGHIQTYAWKIDGVTRSNAAVFGFTFNSPGNHDIELTVTDNQGASSTAQKTITVSSPTAPPPDGGGSGNGEGLKLSASDDIGASGDGDRAPLNINHWDHGYYKFPLSGVSGAITHATLRLYSYGDNLTTRIWQAASDNWSEASGPPAEIGYDGRGTLIAATSHSGAGYVEWDVTGFVQAEYASDQQASFEVTNNEGGWRRYGSRESSYPPELIIETGSGGGGEGGGNGGGGTPPPSENLAPTARIVANPDTGNAPLSVNFSANESTDPDGYIYGYEWTFEPGQTSNSVDPRYTFNSAGTYTVHLTVTDNQGASDSTSQVITVAPPVPDNQLPVANIAASPTHGEIPLTVVFSADNSTDNDGYIASYRWTIDGQQHSTQSQFSETFTTAGQYTVTLVVTDNSGASSNASVTINTTGPVSPPPSGGNGDATLAPSDDIGASGQPTRIPLSINHWDHGYFKFPLGTVNGDITRATLRLYSYGDTLTTQVWEAASDHWSEASANTPEEIGYAGKGNLLGTRDHSGAGYVEWDVTDFTAVQQRGDGVASFEVTNDEGGWRSYGSRESAFPAQLVLETTSHNALPVARFTAAPLQGIAPLNVSFDASASSDSDGSITHYTWDFGDGTTASGQTTEHTYATPGLYTTTLQVTDNLGALSSVFSLAVSVRSSTDTPQPNRQRVYFIGNSVTDGVKYTRLENLATSRGKEHLWGRHMIPGAPLEWIWNHPDTGFNEEPYQRYPIALNNYTWDALSLQPFDRGLENSTIYATRFMDLALAVNPDTQVYIYAYYPRLNQGGWEEQWLGDSSIRTSRAFFIALANNLSNGHPAAKPVKLFPIGEVMYEMKKKIDRGEVAGMGSVTDFYADNVHMNNKGEFLSTMTVFAMLYGEDPSGLSAEGYGISNELASVIQSTVWETVQPFLSGTP